MVEAGSLVVAVLEVQNGISMSTVNAKIIDLKGEPLSTGVFDEISSHNKSEI